jgi:hypothetical protein
MPRALSLQRTIVTRAERDRFLTRARTLRAHYEAAGCHYWVFEEVALTGAFIEFAEGPSTEALSGANASSPDGLLDPGRIYREVGL